MWNPQFASPVLEREYWRNSFPQLRSRFRWGLGYVILTSAAWFIFHLTVERSWSTMMPLQIGCLAMIAAIVAILAFTFTRHYLRFYLPTSFIVMFLVCILSLLFFTVEPSKLSSVGAFITSLEVVLVLYTIVPLPLYVCIVSGVIYSGLYEVISLQRIPTDPAGVKLLLHLCIHILGLHIFIISQVRERKTFLKVEESRIARRDLGMEKQLNKNMIISVMPPLVYEQMKQQSQGKMFAFPDPAELAAAPGATGRKIFRFFYMEKMENVSILFADIVGFTRMSSNKTAEQLVDLLNDLFGRFDDLCRICQCEKISTLGDCYYCVSGCPVPNEDHASRCVEMGLQMVKTIDQFDRDRRQDVNMRVGIHTGNVMCGIVGTHRFKFDVFSNDVTLANEMESSGVAGRVHISEETKAFLGDKYFLEPWEEYRGHKTYLVVSPESQNRKSSEDKSESDHCEGSGTQCEQPISSDRSGVRDDQGVDYLKFPHFDSSENMHTGTAGEDSPLTSPYAITRNATSSVSDKMNPVTLTFKESDVEQSYRQHFSGKSSEGTGGKIVPPTYSVVVDTLVAASVFVLVSLVAWIVFGAANTPWVVYFSVSFVLLVGFLVVFLYISYKTDRKLPFLMTSWFPRHIAALILLDLPLGASLGNLACGSSASSQLVVYYIGFALILAHCNFFQVCHWLKSLMAAIVGLVLVLLAAVSECTCDIRDGSLYPPLEVVAEGADNITALDQPLEFFHGNCLYRWDSIIDVLLALILVTFLNRQFESIFRLSFYRDNQSSKDMEEMRCIQAIIPDYVLRSMDFSAALKYRRIHAHAAVMFLTIANWDEFYDEASEDYDNGRHIWKFVNKKFFTNVDALFGQSRFGGLEKIKTVGPCYMIVSGINGYHDRDMTSYDVVNECYHVNDNDSGDVDPCQDVVDNHDGENIGYEAEAEESKHRRIVGDLVEFAFEVQHILEQFYQENGFFEFKMKAGISVGDASPGGSISTGIIGRDRIQFDCWGLVVNLASRLCATAGPNKLQLFAEDGDKFEDSYSVRPRHREVYLKGVGYRRTCFLEKM